MPTSSVGVNERRFTLLVCEPKSSLLCSFMGQVLLSVYWRWSLFRGKQRREEAIWTYLLVCWHVYIGVWVFFGVPLGSSREFVLWGHGDCTCCNLCWVWFLELTSGAHPTIVGVSKWTGYFQPTMWRLPLGEDECKLACSSSRCFTVERR